LSTDRSGTTSSRREVLKAGAVLTAGAALAPLLGGRATVADATPAAGGWYAPADTLHHERTWMAWPARRRVWGSWLEGVRSDVAGVARAVAEFEPVSMVARPSQAKGAASACGASVEIVEIANDDCWMRDIGPVFLIDGKGGLAGLDMNFNGWGGRQIHVDDRRVAARVLAGLGVRRFVAPFVSEGGALEVDGAGTALATESSIVNDNRNPGKTRARLSREIRRHLGVDEVLWVPGVRDHDITDDHIDALARFVRPGHVMVDQPADPTASDVWARSERQALRILRRSTDARGRTLRCRVSHESRTIPPGTHPRWFVRSYVNWYVCNGAVMIPAFTDRRADSEARALVRDLYPGRKVVQLRIDTLGDGGGGIHCVTQQQPAV
jgi:agmatine deiminase